VTSRVRRAGAFALVATLSLVAPIAGAATAVPFAAIGAAAATLIDDGPVFELFARPGDRQDGRLNGLAGFGFAAAGLALLLALPQAGLPAEIFVAALLVLGVGNLGTEIARTRSSDPFLAVAGFLAGGVPAAIAGQFVVAAVDGETVAWSAVILLAVIGGLIAALLRELLYERDDPVVVLSVGLASWFVATLVGTVPTTELIAAVIVTVALGWDLLWAWDGQRLRDVDRDTPWCVDDRPRRLRLVCRVDRLLCDRRGWPRSFATTGRPPAASPRTTTGPVG